MAGITITPELLANFELAHGPHAYRDHGMCVMEAAAYLAGEPHSDHPECVSPVIGDVARTLNDVMAKAVRQELKQVLPDLLHTRDDRDSVRRLMVSAWALRVWLPRWLDLVPECTEDAVTLRALSADNIPGLHADLTVGSACEHAKAAVLRAWHAECCGCTHPRPACISDWSPTSANDHASHHTQDAIFAAGSSVLCRGVGGDVTTAAYYAGWAAAATMDDLDPVVLELQHGAIELLRELAKAPSVFTDAVAVAR